MKNLTVLIGSCDAYAKLWEPFQICFNKYWKHDTENIFVTDNEKVPNYTNTKFKTVTPGNLNWGERMLISLNECKDEYVFWLLEDYFIQYEYLESDINRYINFMKKNNVDRLQISPSGHQTYSNIENDGFIKFSKNSNYLISMQPSIWNVNFIKKVLLPNYSPWDFELKGTESIRNKNNEIYIDKTKTKIYFNAVRRGLNKSDGWDMFFKQQGLKSINKLTI